MKAYVTHNNEPTKIDLLQNFIHKLSDYARLNGLKLQPQKCTTLYIGASNRKNPYFLNNITIPSNNIVRDLGLQVSSDLNFHYHVKHAVGRALSRLYLLFKFIRSYDIHFLCRLYVIYVRSLLDFADRKSVV